MERYLILAILLFVVTLFASFAVALAVLIGLPYDYFRAARTPPSQRASRGIVGRVGVVLKNLLGAMLILIGTVLSLPGIPGQGLLTVFAGVVLLDFPGKRRLLYELLNRPPLLRHINRLRKTFSRAPLVMD